MEILKRYLATVKQELPVDQQADIIRELQANILDEVEALEESGETNANAIQTVIEKYGHPTATAQSFAPQAPLVAGEDMPFYKNVLIHGAALILVFSLIRTLSLMLLSDSLNPIRLVFQTMGHFIEHAGLLLIIVTLCFYYLGKNGSLAKSRYKNWSIAKLPTFPEAKISLSDIFTDLTSLSFLLLLLWTPLWMSKEGLDSLLFSLSPSSEHWRLILTFISIASLLFALFRLSQTSWQAWTLIAYIGDHIVFAIAYLWMASEPELLIINNIEIAQNWPILERFIDGYFQYFLVSIASVLLVLASLQVRKLNKLRHSS